MPSEELVHRGAELGSFDEAANTVDVIWTTGAAVRRRGWPDGEFDEELVVDKKSIRLDRLNGGAPFLNSHSSHDLSRILGSVVTGSVRIDAGKGRATIQLSRRAEVAGIVQDIRDGVIRNISVGYKIHGVEKQERAGSVPVHRITDWEPMELSDVAIPADPGAQFREEPSMPQSVSTGAEQTIQAERLRVGQIVA